MNVLTFKEFNKFDEYFSLYKPNQSASRCFPNEKVSKWLNFQYNIDDYGFRNNKIDKEQETILIAGCSLSFGEGLSYEQTFFHHIKQELPKYQIINVSMPSSGPDMQILNINWAVKNFNIHKIIWCMSSPIRQLLSIDNNFTIYSPNLTILDKENNDLFHSFYYDNIESFYTKTYWNLLTVLNLLEVLKIDLFFNAWDEKFTPFVEIMNTKRYFNRIIEFKCVDYARDGMHHGPISHLNFSKNILGMLNES